MENKDTNVPDSVTADHQSIPPTPDGFLVSHKPESKSKSQKSLPLKPIVNFFKPTSRKLALVICLTITTLGFGAYVYHDSYSGTAKKSNAARYKRSTPTPTPTPAKVYDVILYDDTSAGVSALKALATTAQTKKTTLQVVWVKESIYKKAMAQNGLNIEDLYHGSVYQSGNLKLFRQAVDSYYGYSDTIDYSTRTSPYILKDLVNEKDRQTYTNTAATQSNDKVIANLLNSTGKGVVLTKAYGYLKDFNYNSGTKLGTVGVVSSLSSSQSPAYYSAKYFIDTSVEADLARMMGASYKLGLSEKVYNDKTSPAVLSDFYNSSTNLVPQAFTVLLNLQKYTTSQLYSGAGFTPNSFSSKYSKSDGTAYTYNDLLAQFTTGGCNITHMLNTPIGVSNTSTFETRSNLYEFNQTWNDYTIPKALFDWYMNPVSRSGIREEAQNFALHALRYLQEKCPGGNLYNLPASYTFPNVYVRGEMRIVGQKTFTVGKLYPNSDSVAIGYYRTYDRHLAMGQSKTYTPPASESYVEVPYLTMIPQTSTAYPALNNLIVTTAISSDYAAYNSSVRMEATRFYLGEAAGTATALAKAAKSNLNSVSTATVQNTLKARGVKITIN